MNKVIIYFIKRLNQIQIYWIGLIFEMKKKTMVYKIIEMIVVKIIKKMIATLEKKTNIEVRVFAFKYEIRRDERKSSANNK